MCDALFADVPRDHRRRWSGTSRTSPSSTSTVPLTTEPRLLSRVKGPADRQRPLQAGGERGPGTAERPDPAGVRRPATSSTWQRSSPPRPTAEASAGTTRGSRTTRCTTGMPRTTATSTTRRPHGRRQRVVEDDRSGVSRYDRPRHHHRDGHRLRAEDRPARPQSRRGVSWNVVHPCGDPVLPFQGVPSRHFAARFAAKEAVLKALPTAWEGPLPWRSIEIINDADGLPLAQLLGALQDARRRARAWQSMDVSLSHMRRVRDRDGGRGAILRGRFRRRSLRCPDGTERTARRWRREPGPDRPPRSGVDGSAGPGPRTANWRRSGRRSWSRTSSGSRCATTRSSPDCSAAPPRWSASPCRGTRGSTDVRRSAGSSASTGHRTWTCCAG